MLGGGKKAAPKKAAAAGRNYGKTAANSKAASSATGRSSSFVDVTGRPYVEVDTFVPKYDEIGVMPPLGRWDPLQIREQGPERDLPVGGSADRGMVPDRSLHLLPRDLLPQAGPREERRVAR